MPFATEIDGYYGDFGNGYVPFFAVIGAFNILMYGDNGASGAMSTVPDAINSFQGVGVVNPIPNMNMYYNESTTLDVSDVFAQIDGLDVTVILGSNSNPEIASVNLVDETLTIDAGDTSGSTTVSLLGVSGEDSATEEFTVQVSDPDAQYIIIWDFDPTPTGSELQASIQNLYTEGEVFVTSDINAYPLGNADAVFVLLGIYSNNYAIGSSESDLLVEYLNAGGKVYMEGGDTWNYDTQTPAHAMFNINAPSDGTGDLSNVTGLDFLSGMNWSYSGENNYIDHLTPVAPAVSLFNSGSYDCGIAYDSGTYKTIGTSFEITGLSGTNSLDDAVEGILNYFELLGPLQTGTIAGTVTDMDGNYLQDVTITAGSNTAMTDMGGEYEMEVNTGTYSVTAQKDGYTNFTITDVEITEGVVTTVDFQLIAVNPELNPPRQLAGNVENDDVTLTWIEPYTGGSGEGLEEDFESGTTLPDGWDFIQTNTNASGTVPAFWTVNDYVSADFSPMDTYHAGLWWDYGHQDEWLITPEFDCGGSTSMEFWTAVYEGSVNADHYYIKVSTDGGSTWTEVWDASTLTGNAWNYYQYSYVIDLSAFAGETIKLAFNAVDGPTNDGLWYIWFIDNITISGSAKSIQFSGKDLTYHSAGESSIARNGNTTAVTKMPESTTLSRDLTGYNVYRDGEMIGSTTELMYVDSNLSEGTYDYMVTAVYDEGESVPVGPISVTVENSDADSDIVPLVTTLQGNYPNPFNPTTTIRFTLAEASDVHLEVYNVKGQSVATLIDQNLPAQQHYIEWNGINEHGNQVPSGIYFYKLKAGRYNSIKKMILMK